MIDFTIKPSLDDWFNLERQEDLISSFSTLYPTLCCYGNIDECLIAWIKFEVVNELMNHSSFESMNTDGQDLLKLLVTKEYIPESSSDKYSDLIEACDKSIFMWCDIYWQNKIDSLFLRFKDKLDCVSCYFMRVEKREIATEIFHRLKAKEQTFDQLGLIYGLGKERFKGSYFESQCLSALPKKLIPYAKMLKEGQMSDPIEIGKNIYALFRLENYAAATLNEENKLAIYKLHFEEWCRYILPSLHSTIRANL